MQVGTSKPLFNRVVISLVDGDPTVRHARQLMLQAENYNVRSYASCDALIADPSSCASACLVVDVDMSEVGGLELLQRMRAKGWRGSGILLDGSDRTNDTLLAAARNGDTLLARSVADRPLLNAVKAAVGRAAA